MKGLIESLRKKDSIEPKIENRHWLNSQLIVVTFLCLFIAILVVIKQNAERKQAKELKLAWETISGAFELKLKGNDDYIKMLSVERVRGLLTLDKFQYRVSYFIKQHPEFINITGVNSDFFIVDAAPIISNKQIIGLHIELNEPKRASHLAKDEHIGIYTKPFNAIQGEPSFEIWYPVYDNEKFLGLFAGVYSCKQFLKSIVPMNIQANYSVKLINENGTILASFPETNEELQGELFSQKMPFIGNGINLVVQSKNSERLSWDLVLLISICMILAAVLFYVIWRLKQDSFNKKEIEQSLRKERDLLNRIMETSPGGIMKLDKVGKVLFANKRAEEILGYTFEELENTDYAPSEIKITDLDGYSIPEEGLSFYVVKKALKSIIGVQRSIEFKNGRKIFLSISAAPMFNDENMFDGAIITFDDITREVQSMKSLAKTESRYHSLFDNMLEGFVYCKMLYDDDGKPIDFIYLDMNKAFEKLTGLKNVIGRKATEMIPGIRERDEELFLTHNRVAQTGIPARFEMQVNALGQWYAVSLYSTKKEYFVSVFDNITERKNAEKALQQSEEKYRKLVEVTKDAIFINQDYCIVYLNPAAQKLFGAEKPEQILGKSPLEIFHPEYRKIVIERITKMHETGKEVETIEEKIINLHGVTIDVEVTATPFLLNGKAAIQVVLRDISERKNAEFALRESEEKFHALVENAADAFFLHDFNGKIIEINKQTCNNLGYSRDELLAMSIPDIEQDYSLSKAQEAWESIPIGRPITLSSHEKRKDGSVFPVEVRLICIYLKGRKLILGLIRDVTERKHAEEALQSSLQEKDVLMRELYHRTKNNMQVISSMLGLKALYVKDSYTCDILKDMESRILSMALVHKRLYESKNLSRINLKDYILELSNLLLDNYKVDVSKVSMRLELEDINVLIDTAIPCGMIINELLSNSIKYAFPGARRGEIEIHLCRLTPEMIELKVSDDGIGMPGDYDFNQQNSLGSLLLFSIVENQLQGEISYEFTKGVSFIIKFKDVFYSERV
jgi:PAS domain S-box-containing protein